MVMRALDRKLLRNILSMRGQITGSFEDTEARDISIALNSGSMAVISFAEPAACWALCFTPPAPSKKITERFMPAEWARSAASTCSSKVEPLTMRLSVSSSPDSGPM